MKYDLNLNVLDEVKKEFTSALSFIAETDVYVTFEEPYLIQNVAGVKHYEVKGEYSAGDATGVINFMYVETPTEYTVNRLFVSMGAGGISDCPFSDQNVFFKSLANKHKLYVTTSRTKPIRMQRIQILCDELKNLSCKTETHKEIVEIVDKIINQLG